MESSPEVSEPLPRRSLVSVMARSLSARQTPNAMMAMMPELGSACAAGDSGAVSGRSSWQGASLMLHKHEVSRCAG